MKDKFRVWCKDKQEWERDIIMISQAGELFHFNHYMQPMVLRRDRHVVQWFSGIYDKNDREIYEGDIIDLHQTVNGVGTFEVIYNPERYGWGVRYYTDRMDHRIKEYEYSIKDFFCGCSISGEVDYEVIGNIYEKETL